MASFITPSQFSFLHRAGSGLVARRDHRRVLAGAISGLAAIPAGRWLGPARRARTNDGRLRAGNAARAGLVAGHGSGRVLSGMGRHWADHGGGILRAGIRGAHTMVCA